VSRAQTGAIFASTPRPEAAELFVSWIASADFQKSRSSTQLALNTDAISPLLSNVTVLSGFRQFEQGRATIEWWKNLYEECWERRRALSSGCVPQPAL
jgi:ABC-type Fe3+ transport system substrate-binding protein